MLQINMADVMNVIGSLTPYLIAIGVLFALALIITFAVNKKTVKDVATRKIVHSESWLVALVGIVVAVSMMLTGPLSTLLNNATTTKYMLSDTTVSKANELAKEVQSEAITMLKNKGVKKIRFMCIVAAPQGIERMQKEHPDVDLYVGALDDHLNENGYIPGLGDAGDRIFGTK